ncbi:NAD(P)H-dependent oxidoreductase [Isosphaeraceae bacterium EP7]
MRVLAISGSLRAASSNSTLIRSLAALAPEGMDVVIFDGLAGLPHFNPDHDEAEPPPAVAAFRELLGQSDALIVCSPEYAHGIPGSLKNALDWTVGGASLMDKPIAIINASPNSVHVHAQLSLTLGMLGRLVVEASPTVPLAGRKLDEAGIIATPEIADPLRLALMELARVIGEPRAGSSS